VKIDPHSNTPVFEQIADSLRSGVVAGSTAPARRSPRSALCPQAPHQSNTITRAVEQLERDGIIESRKGLGMFVTDAAPDIARTATERSVHSTFTQGIHLGRAAQLQSRIDEVYRKAWPASADGANDERHDPRRRAARARHSVRPRRLRHLTENLSRRFGKTLA